jgi:polyisoprenoid-binding protein YceI
MNLYKRFLLVFSVFFLFVTVACAQTSDVPVFKVTPVKSTIKFNVKASVPIEGVFEKWEATLTFSSNHAEDGVLDVKIQANSVNTGSGVKDGKLKSKDFFNADQDPYITFHSTKAARQSSSSSNQRRFVVSICAS